MNSGRQTGQTGPAGREAATTLKLFFPRPSTNLNVWSHPEFIFLLLPPKSKHLFAADVSLFLP